MPKPWFGCGVPLLQRHWSLRWGECAHCGKVGFCPSYVATKMVVAFGVPVLPLGRVYVHEECVHCQDSSRHELEGWESRREKVLVPALTAYVANPTDAGLATAALQEVVELGEAEEFEALAQQVETQFAKNPEILRQLAWCHGHFADFVGAARVYERAGSALAKTYDALPEEPPPNPPSAVLQGVRALLLPLPLLVIIGVTAYLATVFKEKIDTVYFVNGTSEPYGLVVNGKEMLLPALGEVPWVLSPGQVAVSPLPGSSSFEPFQFKLIARQGGRPVTAVVNPDKLAVISWEELVYQNTASEGGQVNADQFAVHATEPFYLFFGITDHFADPPETLEIHSEHQETYRYVLHYLREPPDSLCALLLGQGEMEAAETYCQLQLTHNPEQHRLLPLLSEFGLSSRVLEFMEARLMDRPLRLAWHRNYIQLVRSMGDRAVVEARYEKHVAESPEEGDFHYLLGLTRENREAAILDYQRAVTLGSIDAMLPVARQELALGDFEKALSLVDQVEKARPEDQEAALLRQELLLATSQYEPLIAHYRERLKGDLLDEEAAMTLAGLLEANGQSVEAEAVVDRYLQAVSLDGALMSEETAASRSAFSAVRAQWAGAVGDYVSLAGRLDGQGQLNVLILQGDLASAASSVERGASDPFLHFLLYALTACSKETLALSEVQLSQALTLAESLPNLASTVAPWFRSGGAPPTLEETLQANVPNYERRVLLFALAQRHPEASEAFLEMAARLNYHRLFPYLALKQALLNR